MSLTETLCLAVGWKAGQVHGRVKVTALRKGWSCDAAGGRGGRRVGGAGSVVLFLPGFGISAMDRGRQSHAALLGAQEL